MFKIETLKVGDTVSGEQLVLMLSSATKGVFKNKEGFYLNCNMQDNTGTISGKMWTVPKELETLHLQVEEEGGVYVGVSATVESYKGQLQLNIAGLEVLSDDKVDPSQFLPVVARDREDMVNKLRELINQIQDKQLKSLVVAVFSEKEYFDGYINGIGGIKMHHNYIGGLLEHSLQVTFIGLHAVDNPYLFPEVNRDLIIAGGLLHDIGKVVEYLFSRSLSMNPNGIEHRYEGIGIIEKVIFKNDLEIEPKLLRDIKHIIAAHHGVYSDQSLKLDTPEAIIIHNADGLSAHVNGMLNREGLLGTPFKLRQR